MIVGVCRDVVDRLTPVPLAERQRFLDLPPTREAHEAAHASVAAFNQIELQPGESPTLAGAIPTPKATTATALLRRCRRRFRSSYASTRRRTGTRRLTASAASATAANIGRFVACSVHLENRTDGAGRARQMQTLLDALDAYAGGALPVVIGGDLNTHVGPGGYHDASEPLFALAASRGYDWAACNLAQPSTRASTWSTSEGTRQLDWFCTRGLSVRDPTVVPALGEDGSVLSDHELILLTLDMG
jgi:endonuclease/exonuclease/phosphatase family metal-dependent hydrolase